VTRGSSSEQEIIEPQMLGYTLDERVHASMDGMVQALGHLTRPDQRLIPLIPLIRV